MLPAAAHTHGELPLLPLSPPTAGRKQRSFPRATPSRTPTQGASPRTPLPAVIHTEGHIQREGSHPFSYRPFFIHALTQPRSSPMVCARPRSAHTQPTLPPHSLQHLTHSQHSHPFLHSDCFTQTHTHTHTHSHTHSQPVLCLVPHSNSSPPNPLPQESGLILCFTE